MRAPPLPLLPSFTQTMPTAGKTTQSTHSSGVGSVASCALTSRREEAHLGQEEMELPSRKRNQRTEDSQPVPWCKCGKKPRQNGSVDSRNLRKKKKKLVSIWVTPLLREGNWYYFLLIRTCLHGAGAQSFIGDLLAFGNRLRMLSSLYSPPSLDHDPGYRQTE